MPRDCCLALPGAIALGLHSCVERLGLKCYRRPGFRSWRWLELRQVRGVIDGSYDTVSQVLTTTSGQLYDLTFWLYTADGNADADFRALWDGVVVYDNPAGTDSAHQFPWTQITVSSLSGTGSDLLAFQAYNPPFDTRLDLVDVQPVSAPEPASWVLMSIGALAIAYRRLR